MDNLARQPHPVIGILQDLQLEISRSVFQLKQIRAGRRPEQEAAQALERAEETLDAIDRFADRLPNPDSESLKKTVARLMTKIERLRE